MNSAYLLLGSNIGDKYAQLIEACRLIGESCGSITIQSSLYETSPWGNTQQPSFLNQVIQVKTDLLPEKLLTKLLNVEKSMGRVRKERWGERIIDIDILYYNRDIIVSEKLKVPHPEIQNRRFTLTPLSEIAPSYRHPVLNLTSIQMLQRCTDSGEVTRIGFNV